MFSMVGASQTSGCDHAVLLCLDVHQLHQVWCNSQFLSEHIYHFICHGEKVEFGLQHFS